MTRAHIFIIVLGWAIGTGIGTWLGIAVAFDQHNERMDEILADITAELP
jgi:hypothetical protein